MPLLQERAGTVGVHEPATAARTIRVLLAEDHAVVRAGLVQLLMNTGDMEAVGTAANGRQAVELARSTRPDVVLMDISMPELDGIAATRAITASAPEVRVLILTAYSEQRRIRAARRAGAAGFLLKESDADELY